MCTFAFTTGPSVDPIIFQGRLKVCSKYPRVIYTNIQDPYARFLLKGQIVPARGPPVFGRLCLHENAFIDLLLLIYDRLGTNI